MLIYYRGNYVAMNNYLENLDLLNMFTGLTVQQCCDILYGKVAFAVDSYIQFTDKPI